MIQRITQNPPVYKKPPTSLSKVYKQKNL